jgi:hypothetical protein
MSIAPGVADAQLEITPFDDRLVAAHARFAARMWPSKRRRADERFNRWKFRGPATGPVSGLLLAVADGEVVGQLGLIPVILSIDGTRFECQWVCDVMVDAAERRRRIATRLLESAMARGMVTLGSNPSRAADFTMQRVGFESFLGPRMSVLPLDPAHVISWKIPRSLHALAPLLGRVIAPFLSYRARALDESASAAGGRAERVEWREVVSRVRRHQETLDGPYVVHDEDFLRWRCSGLDGFVSPLSALRTGAGSYAIVGVGLPNFYALDWAADSSEDFLRLFAGVRTMALEAGAKSVQAYADTDAQLRWLRRNGFLTMRRPCQILCHPGETFRPRHTRMNYSIFDSDGNL